MVNAYIARDPLGVHRIFVQRAKYKHWFELGLHSETNVAFASALEESNVHWSGKIKDETQLF